MKKPRRVAVTGLGIITAIGQSVPEFKRNLFAGKCGIGPITLFDTLGFPTRNGGQIAFFKTPSALNPRESKRGSRCDHIGLIAAREALSNAALDVEKYDKYRFGVILGGGAGGMRAWEKYRRAQAGGGIKPKPSLLMPFSSGTLTDLIGSHYGFCGTRTTITTACSSSSTAVGYGLDLIQSGSHDVVMTGGSEALSELTFAGFNALRVTDPEYCRPFDKNRRGLSLGEGAAMIVLEDFRHAKLRGARIYAEILGYAVNADAFHMTAPDPEGTGMYRVMKNALENAGITADRIDYINAHGTATIINDKMETRAIKRVFGKKKAASLAVSSTKSMVGHCLGASGAIEAVATILALQEQVLPPTVHYQTPDPECDLDYVPNHSRKASCRLALSNSFAFGGNNTALVLAQAGI